MLKTRIIINGKGTVSPLPLTPTASGLWLRQSTWRGLMAWFGCAVLLVSSHLSSLGTTAATFRDPEVSEQNSLQAGWLTFQLAYPEFAIARLSETSTAVGSLVLALDTEQPVDSLPAEYVVHGRLAETVPTGCELLQLEARFGEYVYSGLLSEFVSLPMSAMGSWTFTLALPVDNLVLAPDAVCAGELYFETGVANAPEHAQRVFSDDQSYTFEIRNWPAPGVLAPLFVAEPMVQEINTLDVTLPEENPTLPPENPTEILTDIVQDTSAIPEVIPEETDIAQPQS